MKMTMVIQGREITHDDIESVRRLVKAHPSWKRTQLSRELCLLWNWRATNGQMKDMACRTFLVKLEQRGYISLPPSQKGIIEEDEGIYIHLSPASMLKN
jgi:hypothetical protein